jgi:hypothetical protein
VGLSLRSIAGTRVFVTAFFVRNITHFTVFVNPAGRKGEKVGAMMKKHTDFFIHGEEKWQKIKENRFP